MDAGRVIDREAPAKVNLFLHVTGRRADGYHELESLFVFTRRGDKITARMADTLSLEITGPFAGALAAAGGSAEGNLVYKAAQALQQAAGVKRGASIVLDKRLPIASGIGGGSADAAAALLVLNDLWQLGWTIEQLAELALELGADVPACLYASPLIVRGIGEQITKAQLPKAYGILLVNPLVAVSTPSVFGAYKQQSAGFAAPLSGFWGQEDPLHTWLLAQTRNDLEAPAISVCPDISGILERLRGLPGCQMARMSGSGATCFALFENEQEAEAAAARLQVHSSDHWYWVDTIFAG